MLNAAWKIRPKPAVLQMGYEGLLLFIFNAIMKSSFGLIGERHEKNTSGILKSDLYIRHSCFLIS